MCQLTLLILLLCSCIFLYFYSLLQVSFLLFVSSYTSNCYLPTYKTNMHIHNIMLSFLIQPLPWSLKHYLPTQHSVLSLLFFLMFMLSPSICLPVIKLSRHCLPCSSLHVHISFSVPFTKHQLP